MMGFYHGLAGIFAATKELDVVGNNIANARTSGFKRSRAEFADVFSAEHPGRPMPPGLGVYVAAIKQNFNEGTPEATGIWSDLAIKGNGFFITRAHPTPAIGTGIYYTRNSEFKVDKDGYIVNNNKDRLQGWLSNSNGQIVPTALSDIKLDLTPMLPEKTTKATFVTRLDPAVAPITTGTPDPSNPKTYNYTSNVTTYTAQGVPENLSLFYVKTAANEWTIYASKDGAAPSAQTSVTFDSNGLPTGSPSISIDGINVDLSDMTQVSTGESSINTLAGNSTAQGTIQNGYPAGQVSAASVTDSGLVDVAYTNGRHQILAQIPLAMFTSLNGLAPTGDNRWSQTFQSGDAIIGAPGLNGSGTILSGHREMSNVDLSQELVDMIVAQRYYQANTKTIQTHDQIMQTVINIR
jgi:flagellar hook protein FlgE